MTPISDRRQEGCDDAHLDRVGKGAMTPVSIAVGGFLAAVLWFDLMFDTQVLGQPPGPLDEATLESITTYYQRVLIDASPMGRLVGASMLVGWVSVGFQLKRGELRGPLGWATAALLYAPTLLAGARIVPDAARLASRADTIAVQSELARTICWDHLTCLAAIALFIGLQTFSSIRRERAVGPDATMP